MAQYFGFNMPFYGGQNAIMSRQEDERLIKNDIMHSILVLPGELPFRPNFGVNLRNFTFETMDDASLTSLEDEIRFQIVKNDPRLSVKLVRINAYPDNYTIEINIVVSLYDVPDNNIEIKKLIKIAPDNK